MKINALETIASAAVVEYRDTLVNIAEIAENGNTTELNNNIEALAARVDFESDKGRTFEESAALRDFLGDVFYKFVCLYLNLESWANVPEWLAAAVRGRAAADNNLIDWDDDLTPSEVETLGAVAFGNTAKLDANNMKDVRNAAAILTKLGRLSFDNCAFGLAVLGYCVATYRGLSFDSSFYDITPGTTADGSGIALECFETF